MQEAKLILASTSPYRKRLLDRVGLRYEAIAPEYEERSIKGLSALELISAHSTNKAKSVFDLHPRSYVIGSDQGLIFEGELLGKGKTFQNAATQLERLSGKVAILATAVTIIGPDPFETWQEIDQQFLKFRTLSPRLIERYLNFDAPFDCAGSFKIESAGPILFEQISGKDPTAIEGLPLMALLCKLSEVGIEVLAC